MDASDCKRDQLHKSVEEVAAVRTGQMVAAVVVARRQRGCAGINNNSDSMNNIAHKAAHRVHTLLL